MMIHDSQGNSFRNKNQLINHLRKSETSYGGLDPSKIDFSVFGKIM